MSVTARELAVHDRRAGVVMPASLATIEAMAIHGDGPRRARFLALCRTLKAGESVGIPGRPGLAVVGLA